MTRVARTGRVEPHTRGRVMEHHSEAFVALDTAKLRNCGQRHPPLMEGHGKEALSEKPKGLLVTADGGGSNGYRVRLWKIELQKLADELHFPITVCHLPPGTSKGSLG